MNLARRSVASPWLFRRGGDESEDLAIETAGGRISGGGGAAPGEAAELQQLRCDNKRLQEENEILQKLLLFRQPGGESMKAKLVFISAQCSIYSIRLLYAVLGVVRSWFHDWRAGDQDPESTLCSSATLSAAGSNTRQFKAMMWGGGAAFMN
jgi:hypothetical protein